MLVVLSLLCQPVYYWYYLQQNLFSSCERAYILLAELRAFLNLKEKLKEL